MYFCIISSCFAQHTAVHAVHFAVRFQERGIIAAGHEGRKQYLLTRMKEKQTFVTSCDDTAFLKTDGEVYRMNGGVLSKA